MKKLHLLSAFLFSAIVLVSSCKPDDKNDNPQPVDNTPTSGDVTIKIKPVFGTAAADFSTAFTNPGATGEMLTFSSLQYILSNFELKGKDGNWYAVPESYFYINHTGASTQSITLKNIKVQQYTDMRFMIGVDSLRNVSGAQTGGLDPITGMFWSWNSGYIFLKLEGSSPAIGGNGKFTYHVGGFRAPAKANVISAVSFGTAKLEVKDGSKTINLDVNLEEFFKNPVNLSVVATSAVTMPGADALKIATNYADMFSVKSIE